MNGFPIEAFSQVQGGPMPMPPDGYPHQTPIGGAALPKEMVDAMRAALRALVDGEDFVNGLAVIENAARAMRHLAVTLRPSAALAHGQHAHPAWQPGFGQSVATYAPSVPNVEQFGARAIRELVAALGGGALGGKKTDEDPVKLVEAISVARDRGLNKLADRLEASLVESYGGDNADDGGPSAAAPNGTVTEHQGESA